MAEALLRGVVRSGLLNAKKITVYDILPERRAVFEKMGCVRAESAEEALTGSITLVAVKPQNVRDALQAVPALPKSLFVSIAAGVSTKTLESILGETSRVVRVMPNTPLLAGKGMTALCAGTRATPEDVAAAAALFRCGGDAVEVEEEAMNAVTALSGSGPAYVFRFAEAMFAAGEGMGLSRELARRLTIGTIAGAAAMLEGGVEAAELRGRVTSPGGTTAAALEVFEEGDFEGLVERALFAARERSVELGREE